MKIFAVADLHLPGGTNKTMDVFGKQWEGHFDRIRASWTEQVGEDDTVLLPGDLSWAMQMKDALEDLAEVGRLPGRKILLRGNHDYWWGSVTRLREALPKNMFALQNDALRLGDTVFCGSRGWTHPAGDGREDAENRRIYERELIRLEMSLEAGEKTGRQDDRDDPLSAAGRKARAHADEQADHLLRTDRRGLRPPARRGAQGRVQRDQGRDTVSLRFLRRQRFYRPADRGMRGLKEQNGIKRQRPARPGADAVVRPPWAIAWW